MHAFASRAGRWPLALTLAALSALAAACAPAARYSSSPVRSAHTASASTATRVGPSSYTITGTELTTVSGNTAYDLVFRLRPEFLRASRSAVIGRRAEPVVYINSSAAGPVSALSSIPIGQVTEIRYVAPGEALLTYGPTYSGGVIVVHTRR